MRGWGRGGRQVVLGEKEKSSGRSRGASSTVETWKIPGTSHGSSERERDGAKGADGGCPVTALGGRRACAWPGTPRSGPCGGQKPLPHHQASRSKKTQDSCRHQREKSVLTLSPSRRSSPAAPGAGAGGHVCRQSDAPRQGFLIPGTCHPYRDMDFTDGMKLKVLRWGDGAGGSGWAQGNNHRGP